MESLQNIVTHKVSNKKNSHAAVFMIGKQKEQYTIVAGNPINKESMDLIKNKIDKVNPCNKAKNGLKSHYKESVKNASISERGATEPGFVKMATKSEQKLVYSFQDMVDDQFFFAIKLSIGRG